MIQTYSIPASPAPAVVRKGSPAETAEERKIRITETDIFSSELNCFKLIPLKYKKI